MTKTKEKNAVEVLTPKVKILPAKTVRATIRSLGKTGREMVELMHATSIQCLLHFQKHGDTSLMVEFVNEARSIKGLVWQGYVSFFQKHSPVKFDTAKSEDGEVLKDENNQSILVATKDTSEKAVDFTVAQAEEAPALNTRDVRGRTDRPFVKPNIAFFKGRIEGFTKQVDRYLNNPDVPADQKMTQDEADATKRYLARLTMIAKNISALPEETPAEKGPAKRNRKAQEKAAA